MVRHGGEREEGVGLNLREKSKEEELEQIQKGRTQGGEKMGFGPQGSRREEGVNHMGN